MQKFAQKRSLVNKFRELSNVSGRVAERYFDPELRNIMIKVRQADNNIRSIALGKSVDGGNAGKDPISLKQLIKDAKKNYNRREYVLTGMVLHRFSEKVEEIINAIKTLDINISEVHSPFLFGGLSPEDMERLRRIDEAYEMSQKKANMEYELLKEAGLADWWHNISSERGRSLAAWEKRYPKFIMELKNATLTELNKSEKLFDVIIAALNDMAKFRARRMPKSEENIENKEPNKEPKNTAKVQDQKNNSYLGAAQKIVYAYSLYKLGFEEYYGKHIRPWVKKFKILEKSVSSENLVTPALMENILELSARPPQGTGGTLFEEKDVPPSAETLEKEVVVKPNEPVVPASVPASAPAPELAPSPTATLISNAPTATPSPSPPIRRSPMSGGTPNPRKGGPQMGIVNVQQEAKKVGPPPPLPQAKDISPKKVELTEQEIREAEQAAAIRAAKGLQTPKADDGKTASHQSFYDMLESLADESPVILAAFIKKYAKSIELTDPETSIKLFNISKSIKE